MLFTDAFLTNAGAQLLTQAVSGSRIIWGQCGCTQIDDQSELDAGTTTFSNFVCKGSSSAAFQLANNTAKISCPMSNSADGCTPGRADAFGLWARVMQPTGGESAEVLVLIAKRGTANASYFPEYVDERTNLMGIVDLSVNVTEGIVQSIEISRTAYALASDLMTEISERQLADARLVSCHTASSTTEGEDQTIYGAKNFMAMITQTHPRYDTACRIETTDEGGKVRGITSAYANSWLTLNPARVPSVQIHGLLLPENETQPWDIGGLAARWGKLYCTSISCSETFSAGSFNTSLIETQNILLETPNAITFRNTSGTRIGGINFNEENNWLVIDSYLGSVAVIGELIPYPDSPHNLGRMDWRWSTVYAETIDASDIYLTNGIVSNTCHANNLYAVNGIRSNGVTDTAGIEYNTSLNPDNYPLFKVRTGGYGNPWTSYGFNPKTGAIILAAVFAPQDSAITIPAGESIPSNAQVALIVSQGGNPKTPGEYVPFAPYTDNTVLPNPERFRALHNIYVEPGAAAIALLIQAEDINQT